MLSILEGWTNWLREQSRSLWVDLSRNEFAASVAGLFSCQKFMAAGKLLEELGLVARKQNSDCNRTYQYLLQVETVQERVNYPTQVLMNCEWGGGLSLKFNNELKQVYMSNDGQSVAQPSA